MSNQLTLWGSHERTSLPALAAGPTPSPSPAGPSTALSGRPVAPVSPSAKPDALKAWAMSGTYGLLFCGSSPSAALQHSLESKLRALMDVNGSPEYVLIWKHWDMLSGPPICALRAVPRLTNASAYTGWHTPTATEQSGGSQIGLMQQVQLAGWFTPKLPSGGGQETRQTPGGGLRKLEDQVLLAGWSTPDHCQRGGEYADPQKALARLSSGHQINLSDQVVLAGWCSPMAQDGTRGGAPPRPQDTGIPLSQQVVGWGTPSARDGKDAGPAFEANPDMVAEGSRLPRKVHGMITPSSSSQEGDRKPGVLNPALSLWLMGFPSDWLMVAPEKTSRGRKSSKA